MGKSKRRWRWVTRDYISYSSGEGKASTMVIVHSSHKRPKRALHEFEGDIEWIPSHDDNNFVALRAEELQQATGLDIPTDRPIKVEFTAKVVK